MKPDRLAEIAARAYRHMTPWTADSFAQTLGSRFAHLACTDHAFVLGQVIADEAEILALACDPVAQGTGEARRALSLFETEAHSAGARTVFLEVAEANTPARGFYQAMGYAQAGLRKNYYPLADGKTDNAVLMRKALP